MRDVGREAKGFREVGWGKKIVFPRESNRTIVCIVSNDNSGKRLPSAIIRATMKLYVR